MGRILSGGVPLDDDEPASGVAPGGDAPPSGKQRLHPALHVDAGGVAVGRVTDDGRWQIVTSARQLLVPAEMKSRLAFLPRPYSDLGGRWSDADVRAWRRDGTAASLSELLALTCAVVGRAVEFPRFEYRSLIGAWAVGTYFHRSFLSYPRLSLSGERESGKSKVLTLLRAMAFNALLMVNPTPAVLFRLIEAYRPTLLLDEVEGLGKEDARDILAILNSGYKAGGTVARVEGQETRTVRSFEVYSPVALAGIRGVNPTTEDRAIPLTLIRGSDAGRLNSEVDPRGQAFGRIRAGCYQALLTRWHDVEAAYAELEIPAWLVGRARELWRPLLTIAHVADQEAGSDRWSRDLEALAREHVQDRDSVSVETEALIATLVEWLGEEAKALVRPGELADLVQGRLGWPRAPGAEMVARWLRRLGFKKAGRDREGSQYEVRAGHLRQLRSRLLLTGTDTE